MTAGCALDLVLLVPGEDEREGLGALLSKRARSLGIRAPAFRSLKHPRRDPGVFNEAQDVLQPFVRQARYALVVLDHEGSGQEDRSPVEVALDLRGRLEGSGWVERSGVVVIEPEFEQWVWADSPHVLEALGWSGRGTELRQALERRGLWASGERKPARPKECVEHALRAVRRPRSSALYRRLAERVTLSHCEDASFQRLCEILARWFPPES